MGFMNASDMCYIVLHCTVYLWGWQQNYSDKKTITKRWQNQLEKAALNTKAHWQAIDVNSTDGKLKKAYIKSY